MSSNNWPSGTTLSPYAGGNLVTLIFETVEDCSGLGAQFRLSEIVQAVIKKSIQDDSRDWYIYNLIRKKYHFL